MTLYIPLAKTETLWMADFSKEPPLLGKAKELQTDQSYSFTEDILM